MDWKGCGRNLIYGITQEFAWRDWGKLRKTYVRVAGLRAEIWTRDIKNTKKETAGVIIVVLGLSDPCNEEQVYSNKNTNMEM
jgi:hypothetical protein